MRLSEETISLADSGDQDAIKEVINAYKLITKSPLYDAVITRLVLFSNWNEEIVNEIPKILGSGDENDKGIERCRKYMIDQPDLVKATEEMQSRLTGEEVDNLNNDKRIVRGKDRAFNTLQNV